MANRRTKKGKASGGRIFGLVILFVTASFLLFKILQTSSQLTVPYSQDEYISKYSKEFKVDKALVAAVIYQESRYRTDAESRVGALGLMQIMPDTGDWIADQLGEEFSRQGLFDPDYNIRYGTWYLSYLLERFDGNLKNSLAAYNAGPGNVDKWLKDDRYSSDGELTDIPFTETSNYVDTVIRMQETYRSRHSSKFLEVTD